MPAVSTGNGAATWGVVCSSSRGFTVLLTVQQLPCRDQPKSQESSVTQQHTLLYPGLLFGHKKK